MDQPNEVMEQTLPITVIVAVRNEAANIARCLRSLTAMERVIVADSHSDDGTADIAARFGADVIQFDYTGGYPKKRQWVLDNKEISTPWVLLLDADEVVPRELLTEITIAVSSDKPSDGYLINKGFHFLGRRFRFGGFSHSAVLLFKTGRAKFEHIFDENPGGMDMEVHERLLVDGSVGHLKSHLIHEDFKGLEAYIARHNQYSSWEAAVRMRYFSSGDWGNDTIQPRLFGNAQERRRFLKQLVCRLPLEHWIWFVNHFFVRLGFLEGRAGLIACRIRAQYIANVKAKMHELHLMTEKSETATVAVPVSVPAESATNDRRAA